MSTWTRHAPEAPGEKRTVQPGLARFRSSVKKVTLINRLPLQIRRFKAENPPNSLVHISLEWLVPRIVYSWNPFSLELVWAWCARPRYPLAPATLFGQLQAIRRVEGFKGIFKGFTPMLLTDSLDDLGRSKFVSPLPWYYRVAAALGISLLKQPLNMVIVRMTTETSPEYASFPKALVSVLKEGPQAFLQGMDLNLAMSFIDYSTGVSSLLVNLFCQKPYLRTLLVGSPYRGFFSGTQSLLHLWRSEGFLALGSPYLTFTKMLSWLFVGGFVFMLVTSAKPALKSERVSADVDRIKEILSSGPPPTLIHCAACDQDFTGNIHGFPRALYAVCTHCGTNVTIRE